MGKLIVFEGIDGSGKSTQAKLLQGFWQIDFPRYDHIFGKIIKWLLHQRWGQKVNPYFLAWLFATDRLLAKPKICGLLNPGKNVAVDRYTGSSQAHQGAKFSGPKRQKIINWIDWLERRFYRLPQPDHVFFLKVKPQITRQLIAKRGRKKDAAEKDLAHQQETFAVYQQLAKINGWHIINSLDERGQLVAPKKIHESIQAKIS